MMEATWANTFARGSEKPPCSPRVDHGGPTPKKILWAVEAENSASKMLAFRFTTSLCDVMQRYCSLTSSLKLVSFSANVPYN